MSANSSQEYRCDCGKLLFKSPHFTGYIEIKCRRCGQIKVFEQQIEPIPDVLSQTLAV